MAIINGFDLDLLNKVADGYDVKITPWSNLVQKKDVSEDVINEAKKALNELMPNSLDFRLNGSVRYNKFEDLGKVKDLTDALEEIHAQRAAAAIKAHAEESYRNRGPMERLNEILGPDYLKYNLKIENGQLIAENVPQEVMIRIYNRLRSLKLPITANIDENGAITGLRGLRAGEQPVEIKNGTVKDEVQLAIDPSVSNEYKNFMNADIVKPTTKNDANKSNDRKNEASAKYELALADNDHAETDTNEETEENDTKGIDALISKRMDERFKSPDDLEHLVRLANELNTMFIIKNGALIARNELTSQDLEFAQTFLDYFYPTKTITTADGRLNGLAPAEGYEPLANVLYATMREAAKAKDFSETMAKKKAAQDELIQVEPIDYTEYVNDYINTNKNNTSDENEIFYNALIFAALQGVKPANERRKYSDIIKEQGSQSVYGTRRIIEQQVQALSAPERTAYANALNDVRESVLNALPPKTLIAFEKDLNAQLDQEDLSAEDRDELISKLNSVQARMDEMIDNIADKKVVFDDNHYLELAENYEGLTAVIAARMTDNPKAATASSILEADIAGYDEAYGINELTSKDAEILNDRSIEADETLDKMGITQFLGRKLRNAVSSHKLSTQREFSISEDNLRSLKGINFTDENGNVIPQFDEKGEILPDSVISQLYDLSKAYAYNNAVLGEGKITRESMLEDANDFIYSSIVNMVNKDMDDQGTPISLEEAQQRVLDLSPENPYQLPLSQGITQIVTQQQTMVGLVDRVGQKIGRNAPVLHKMHDQFKHLDTQMANSRFKEEYAKSNRFAAAAKKLAFMSGMIGVYSAAYALGGAALSFGIVAGMTTMRTLAGYSMQKKQARREGVKAKNFMQYLWSEKVQLLSSTASLTAIASGLGWLSYSAAALNLGDNFHKNSIKNKRKGRTGTLNTMTNGIETIAPIGYSIALNSLIGTALFADHGDPDASFMDNLSHTFSEAVSGLKDVFGFGDAAAAVTPDTPVVDNVANTDTAAGTVAEMIADAANKVAETPQTVEADYDGAAGIQVPHPDLENQTPPPDATFIQSPEEYAAEVAAREAAQTTATNAGMQTTADTATVQNNLAGTAADAGSTAPADTTGTTDGTPASATTGTADATAPEGAENIPDAQAYNHTYDQAAHQHADARIHGQGINYKLDYNEAQLNDALDQIRTIGSDYPQMNSAAGQSNAEILMYKLNQIDQLVAPDTDIVTPEGRVEAQALYGHKMPDGSYYGPHDLRADLLAGKTVDPQIAAEIFAKIEPHIDVTGHHIGDIHNFKEAGTWSYRQTGVGGFTQDLVEPNVPSDGITGHLDETITPEENVSPIPVQDDNSAPIPPVAEQENQTVTGAENHVLTGTENMGATPTQSISGITNTEATQSQGTAEAKNNAQDAGAKGAPFVPYIPYDKPYMSKIRRVLNERIGAWMGPVKRALGIKDPVNPELNDKGSGEQAMRQAAVQDERLALYTGRNADKANNLADGVKNAAGMAAASADVANADTAMGKVPQGPGPKRLVVPEPDLPKDPYFNISPISENVERDVNGAWVADFREGAPKINRTVKTANADYVTGRLPNSPQKGEIEPTVIEMGTADKPKGLPQSREGLPEPQKGLPEPHAIRLGTEQVSDKVIPMDTQEQRDAFKRQMMDGNVPKHIRAVLEQRAKDAKKPRMLLEDKEGKAKLTSEQANALLNKYRDVTAAVDNMKQAPVTQNTTGDNVKVDAKTGRKQPQTQTGNNGKTAQNNTVIWNQWARKVHKEP